MKTWTALKANLKSRLRANFASDARDFDRGSLSSSKLSRFQFLRRIDWLITEMKSTAGMLCRAPKSLFLTLKTYDRLHFSQRGLIERGVGCQIDTNTWLVNGRNIKLGNFVKLSAFSTVMAGESSRVDIGSFTIIGPNVLIAAIDHGFSLREVPIRYQPWNDGAEDSICIGQNVWIGGGAIILRGSSIGDNCIIGAGTLVRGSISPNTIAISRNERSEFSVWRDKEKL